MKLASRLTLGGLVLLAAWSFCNSHALAQTSRAKSADKSDLLDVLDELETKAADRWWNPDWNLRRKVELEGPGLATMQGGLALFRELDPLLLYNTHRCQDGAVDLRVVTGKGQVLPAGVLQFGKDDGTCHLWCALPEEDRSKPRPTFYVYYANPGAPPQQQVQPPRPIETTVDSGIYAWLGPEEAAPGLKLSQTPSVGSFFQSVVAVEAESFHLSDAGRPQNLALASKEASAGALLNLIAIKGLVLPTEVFATAKVPSAGRWRVHVRFQNGLGKKAYDPFTLKVAGQELSCSMHDR